MEVLVISVHPDDETLGCAGTLLKHKEQGDSINWLIITDATKELGYSEEFIDKRKGQLKQIASAYGFKNTVNLGFPTTKLHMIDFSNLVSAISEAILKIKPETIYTVNRSDVHTDHQVVAKAVSSCTKSFRYPFIKRVLMYECLSETEAAQPLYENVFLPNVFSDISDYLGKKLELMNIYDTEVQKEPLPRSLESIEALARFRGTSVGVKYAEAFMLVRERF